jgi:hypothetical protein
MVARKDVVVVSEDGRRLTTQELLYSQQKNEIASDSAFVLTEPDRRVEGIGFRSDPNMKNIKILKGASGIVRGVSTQTAPNPTATGTQPSAPPVVPPRTPSPRPVTSSSTPVQSAASSTLPRR